MPKSALSIFSDAAEPKEKASTSETPSIQVSTLTSAIDNWIKANTDLGDAQSRKNLAETIILPAAEEARIEECRKDHEFHSSVKINDKVLVRNQNRYTDIDSRERGTLEKVFGDKTDDYFTVSMDISLTDVAKKDERILQKLIAAVGEDNLKKYFTIKQVIRPTTLFHEQRILNSEVQVKAKELMESGLVKQYKPSVTIV